MANDSKPAVGADDILPMKKTSSTALIVGGVGAVVVVGLLVFALSGGESAPAKVQATEQAADAKQGMTKAELEERQAHLKKTQEALVAAAADEAESKAAAAPAPMPPPEAEPAEPAKPATASKSSKTPSPAPAKKSGAASKKSMEGLDALGDDIASALK
jgi:hypothetical protein